MAPKVENGKLLEAGLKLMECNGKPLRKVQSPGRSMMYEMQNGETVRVRTCNDHLLIVLSSQHSGSGAKLNIEGTDWLLIVMPEIPRTPGDVVAYLVPTAIAAEASRHSHATWLATKPDTKGNNTTWNLWFEDGPLASDGFAKKWSHYRLAGFGAARETFKSAEVAKSGSLKTEIEAARQQISRVAGVPLDAVRITIQFGL